MERYKTVKPAPVVVNNVVPNMQKELYIITGLNFLILVVTTWLLVFTLRS